MANDTAKQNLQAAQPAQVKHELHLDEPVAAKEGADPELDAKAEGFVKALIDLDPNDLKARENTKAAVEQMGTGAQKEAARMSEMLKEPIKKLSHRAEEGGDVANALVNLKMEVEQLDPNKVNFEPGWFSRAVGALPGVGTPLKRYFTKFESAQTVIDSIIRSLEQGRDQLQRDNTTLTEDQKRMREATIKLEKTIKLGQLIDQKLQYRLERDFQAGTEKHKFVAEELLFPLRQRVIDLQQQLAVNQQGVLATELIIRNNRELVRGVNRALNVTVSALQVAATVALALANQKIVLDKIETVNKTTSDLIAGTAAKLKTQGVAIHKQASGAQIDMNALKSAFADINSAMADISNFRLNALPQMAQTVLEMDKITSEAAVAIKKMEEGNKQRPAVDIKLEA